MQNNDDNPAKSTTRPRLARTRFIGLNPAQKTTDSLSTTGDLSAGHANGAAGEPAKTAQKRATLALKKSARPRLPEASNGNRNTPIEDQTTTHLMQLSGMMRPLHKPGTTLPLSKPEAEEDGYWPLGIQQIGPLPTVNLYGREPFARMLPTAVPLVIPESRPKATAQKQTPWQRVLISPTFKISLGLLIGLSLLLLVSLFIDLPQTFLILGTHLATPQGIALAVLAGITYLSGYSIRGARWKLFLNRIGEVSIFKVIQIYQVATFLNFLLPIRAGEAAKSLVLKRIANIPISKSLPTIAMDKSLDLVPSLVVMALVPFLGIHMDLQLWLVLVLASCVLLVLVMFIGLAAWKRPVAVGLLQKIFGLLPRTIGNRIEGFVTGLVDALLAGASRPTVFLPALLLTCLAVACDGLFTMFAFRAIGFPISFGTALFGYTVYSLFCILPTPPGQVGSNEVVGLLVFGGLLHLSGNETIAMYIFSHPWTALIMTIAGMASLAALGLTISNATRAQNEK